MIYISLTTVPERLKYWEIFSQNIHSLISQETDKEYKVILSIPPYYIMDNNEKYTIPDELIELSKITPKLIINRDTFDYGPIVKVIGGLKYATDMDDIIIALDDDHIYHKEMLEFHIKKLNQYSNHAICFNGDGAIDRRSWIDEDGNKKYTLIQTHFYIPPLCDHYIQIPGHWHSVSYKRSFFKDDFNEDVWKLSTGDDLIMGYYLKKHNIFFICTSWDKEIDFRPTNMFGRSSTCFPIISTLHYPDHKLNAGNLIRTRYPYGNHGIEEKELQDLLYNLEKIYTEE